MVSIDIDQTFMKLSISVGQRQLSDTRLVGTVFSKHASIETAIHGNGARIEYERGKIACDAMHFARQRVEDFHLLRSTNTTSGDDPANRGLNPLPKLFGEDRHGELLAVGVFTRHEEVQLLANLHRVRPLRPRGCDGGSFCVRGNRLSLFILRIHVANVRQQRIHKHDPEPNPVLLVVFQIAGMCPSEQAVPGDLCVIGRKRRSSQRLFLQLKFGFLWTACRSRIRRGRDDILQSSGTLFSFGFALSRTCCLLLGEISRHELRMVVQECTPRDIHVVGHDRWVVRMEHQGDGAILENISLVLQNVLAIGSVEFLQPQPLDHPILRMRDTNELVFYIRPSAIRPLDLQLHVIGQRDDLGIDSRLREQVIP